MNRKNNQENIVKAQILALDLVTTQKYDNTRHWDYKKTELRRILRILMSF